MSDTTANFVPRADRPHARFDDVVEIERDTIWENPTEEDVVLDLHVGTKPSPVFNSEGRRIRPDLSWEEKNGVHRYVIRARHTRSIPKEFDAAIQDVRKGVIVGGLGPRLINRGAQERPRLHPSLDDKAAEHRALLEEAARSFEESKRNQEAFVIAQAKAASITEAVAMAAARSAVEKKADEATAESPSIARRVPKT